MYSRIHIYIHIYIYILYTHTQTHTHTDRCTHTRAAVKRMSTLSRHLFAFGVQMCMHARAQYIDYVHTCMHD